MAAAVQFNPVLDPERASIVRHRAALLDAKKIVNTMSRHQLSQFMAARHVTSKDQLVHALQQERVIILSSSVLEYTLDEALDLYHQLYSICRKSFPTPKSNHVKELLPFLYFLICAICMWKVPYEIQFATGKLVLLR